MSRHAPGLWSGIRGNGRIHGVASSVEIGYRLRQLAQPGQSRVSDGEAEQLERAGHEAEAFGLVFEQRVVQRSQGCREDIQALQAAETARARGVVRRFFDDAS